MKFLIASFFILQSTWATTTSIKFTAKTNGPGISVEGEVKESLMQIDFNKIEAVTFSTDVMNLTTGMEKRDKHLHEKVFQIEKEGVAKIEYTLNKIVCPPDANETLECDCVGILKIKDITNKIKFKALLNKTKKELEGKTTLTDHQFVEKKGNLYKVKKSILHLEKESLSLTQHHTYWRLKAIDAIQSSRSGNLHYSGIMSVSEEDYEWIKEKLGILLEQIVERIVDSKDEKLASICFDLFQV